MNDARKLLLDAISSLNQRWNNEALRVVDDGTDVFSAVDSFAIVEIILETEALLENTFGRYVPIGDQSILDATESPLRQFCKWVDYVNVAVAKSAPS